MPKFAQNDQVKANGSALKVTFICNLKINIGKLCAIANLQLSLLLDTEPFLISGPTRSPASQVCVVEEVRLRRGIELLKVTTCQNANFMTAKLQKETRSRHVIMS